MLTGSSWEIPDADQRKMGLQVGQGLVSLLFLLLLPGLGPLTVLSCFFYLYVVFDCIFLTTAVGVKTTALACHEGGGGERER